MNVKKRFVAYIMCYVMALSLIPVSVFGADETGTTGDETCEHNYVTSKYVWGYQDSSNAWKTLWEEEITPQSPDSSGSGTDESWEDKTIQCKKVLICENCKNTIDDQIVNAEKSTDTSKTYPATCVGTGKTTYIAEFGNGQGETKEKEVIIPIDSTAHSYGEPTWGSLDETGSSDKITVTFTCSKCNDKQTLDGTVTSTTKDATCTQPGTKTYTASVTFNGKEYTKDVKTESIAATGHSYGEPVWTWTKNGDNYKAEAVFTCSVCSNKHTENGTVTPSVQDAGCTSPGAKTYTASVTFEGKPYTTQKIETIAAKGHSYGEPEWTWIPDGDGYKAEAVFTCSVCNDKQKINGTVTFTVQGADCTSPGTKTYTASVTFDEKTYTEQKTESIAVRGHHYGNPTWTWIPDGDGYKAEVVFTCSDCDEQTDGHTLTLQGNDITVEEEITKQPTCMEQGTKTYTASVTFQEQEYKDTKGITLPLASHDTQKMSDAKPASCTADGTMEYYYCKICTKHFSDKAGTNEITQGSWIIKAKDHQITDHLNPSTNTKDGSLVRSCDVCGYVQETFPIPKKKMKIEIGEKLSSQFENAEDASKCTFSLKNKKDKKYFTVDSKTGKITVNAKNYSKISKKAITVNVSNGAGSYPVKVTPQIPAPNTKKIKITPKKEGDYYRFTFKYNIKGAKKIKVRCNNIKGLNPKGFDKYLSSPKSSSDSYVYIKVGKLKKVVFTVTAYYGNNPSKEAKITVQITK